MLELILIMCLAGFLFTPSRVGRPIYRLLHWQESEKGLYKIARCGFTQDDRRNALSQLTNLCFTGKKMFAAYYLGLLYSDPNGEFYNLENALEAFRIGGRKGHIGSEICFIATSYLLDSESDTAEFLEFLKYRPRFLPEEVPLIIKTLVKASSFPAYHLQIQEILATIEKRTRIPNIALQA